MEKRNGNNVEGMRDGSTTSLSKSFQALTLGSIAVFYILFAYPQINTQLKPIRMARDTSLEHRH